MFCVGELFHSESCKISALNYTRLSVSRNCLCMQVQGHASAYVLQLWRVKLFNLWPMSGCNLISLGLVVEIDTVIGRAVIPCKIHGDFVRRRGNTVQLFVFSNNFRNGYVFVLNFCHILSF